MRNRQHYSRALAVTAASLSGFSWANVNAQTEETGVVEEVVVTGFRASLATALETKREANQIVESVAAEDIGKFPDQNVAEALQRLSGVQIDRSNGQGTKVRIRGLDQNVTLLNNDIFLTGLELYTQGEGNFRETDSLEGIPSELLGGIDVYKSPNAAQLEGGLGGIVNLKTRSPFSLGEGTNIAGNLRYADAGEGWEPLGAVVASHKFNERLAVLASVSYDKQVFQTDVLGGQNRGGWKFSDRLDRDDVEQDYFAPEYRYTTDRDEERERLGASISVAFRPTDSLEIEGMWFHSNLDILTQEASLKFPFSLESPGIDITQPFAIDPNGVLLNGTFTANSAEAISFVKNTEINSDNFQLGMKWDNGGAVRVSGSAAYSKADQKSGSANNDVRYTQYGVRALDGGPGFAPNAGAPANYQFRYDNNGGELPTFTLVGNQDLFTNPNNAFFKSHWAFADNTDAENWSVRADLQWDPAFFSSRNVTFSGGVRGAKREIDYEFGRYLADYHGSSDLDGIDYGANWTNFGYFQDGAIGPKACDSLDAGGAPLGTPGRPNCSVGSRFGDAPALILPYQTMVGSPGRVERINGFWSSGNAGTSSVLVQNRGQMNNALAWIQSLYPDTPFTFFPSPLETFNVEEETTSAYLMADIGAPDDGYHINFGARVMRTELAVAQNAALPNPTYWGTDSWNGVLRDYETNVVDRSYTDVLPSANIVLDVAEGHKVRVSAAKVVARQDLFLLGRGFETNFTRNPVTDLFEFTNGSSGNPELEPYRAKQFDLGYEYYFGRQGLAAVTAFRKSVDSFITVVTESVFVPDQAGGRFGPVQRPINGAGGTIEGFELAGQYAFDFGGGFNLNYTYSDSESPFSNDIDSGLPIPGVAKHAYNAQLYYENFGFEARLSYTWRDESFDGNFQFSDGGGTRTYGVWNRDYGQLDAQLGYQVTDSIGLTLEAINLTEEDQSQYMQYENLPFAFESGSRRILLGVRGTFGGATR
ncbi:TonB-dependent receptor [Steroidobacter sp. S1-65]|uniref:TonB-dependent receptor n=1 Tax=Steroidobacter gossypii TaxID=2805490 RepID=A0ABS1WRX5_9GAMM|nr:TonB-dependent receptor [Steroidobacter gossypii]MBM0103712.1 TonB-dependent receptor [Steroidobacter gossypii]